jgi:FKBP-type peptidyl-prolyl cis-trans isomerase FklB
MTYISHLRTYALCLLITALPVTAAAQDEKAATEPDAQSQPAIEQVENATEDMAQDTVSATTPPVASKEDVSYSIGYTIGSEMAQRGSDLDTDQLVAGLKASLGKTEARLTPDEIAQCLFSFQMQMQQQHFAQVQVNLERGLAYLNQNAQQEGVTVTDSGLQYKVIEPGDGATPTVDDVVAARYRGTLIDGTEFDSSGEESVSFPVGRVIPGWKEALQLMKVGDKWELVIPAELAYGETGTPQGSIGPNEVLIFEIELVEIK